MDHSRLYFWLGSPWRHHASIYSYNSLLARMFRHFIWNDSMIEPLWLSESEEIVYMSMHDIKNIYVFMRVARFVDEQLCSDGTIGNFCDTNHNRISHNYISEVRVKWNCSIEALQSQYGFSAAYSNSSPVHFDIHLVNTVTNILKYQIQNRILHVLLTWNKHKLIKTRMA